jgi:hypothetical protein
MHVIICQSSDAAGRRCFFTSDELHPIGRPISNRGLALIIASQWFYSYNLANRFSPLLSQSNERGILWDHALN